MMTEISTPFMNISLMLQLLDRTNESLYVLNGHIFYWTFFVSRPLMLPIFWFKVFTSNAFPVLLQQPLLIMIFWVGLTVGLDLLNVIWTFKITKDYINKVKEVYFTKSSIPPNKAEGKLKSN